MRYIEEFKKLSKKDQEEVLNLIRFKNEIKKQDLKEENERLKKQLEYIRSGEYYNQLRFERDVLQQYVDNKEISKEDKEFIDCTHRNTELLEEKQELIDYLKEKIEISKSDDSVINGMYFKSANRRIYEEILSKIEKR